MTKQIKYYSCIVCKREFRAKNGEFTNDGFKCEKHMRKIVLKIKVPVCKVCNRKTIPELIINGTCSMCIPLQKY